MSQQWGFAGLMICFLSSLHALHVLSLENPNATLSTTWINSISALDSYSYQDGSTVRPILWWGRDLSNTPDVACGFYCNGICDTYMFSIFIVQLPGSNATFYGVQIPQVVWTANRNYPVKENATLQLNGQGEFFLMDADGALVWSGNATGRSVAGLHLERSGNLILFDQQNAVVWQSFDHPTDSLVPAQELKEGVKLRSSVSLTDWSQGLYSFSVHVNEAEIQAVFSIESNPPKVYLKQPIDSFFETPSEPIACYIKLGPDGYMRRYSLKDGGWSGAQYITNVLHYCQLPLVCGQYGMCRKGCTCPIPKYWKQTDAREPGLGCTEITPLTCNESHFHSLVEVNQVTYFAFTADISNVHREQCKEACLLNCSCKAAIFLYSLNLTRGDCYLPTQIFSLMDRNADLNDYKISVFLKVQITPDESSPAVKASHKSLFTLILGSVVGSALLLGVGCFILWKKKKLNGIYDDEVEEDYLKIVSGMPSRFSFQDLMIATEKFSTKLGEGGFGSVYKGSLKDGTKIAVKRLDGICPLKSSFLAEVGSIGSIHHFNLVGLIGYCAEKSYRLLVYEYMENGSLENWIYKGKVENNLDWKCRKNIVLDIAKGLAYLHEDCKKKIIHFDVKPQNILLDEHFNARLSDFGMAKLIARDQSTIVTAVRGTPGYLAPEWLSSIVTEKVDVYSFGVVMMEVLCGRRLFDLSLPDLEQMQFLSLFNQKAKQGRLLDMIENFSEDMKYKKEEVLKMMKVAAWCLQMDFVSRPPISLLVKVLEDVVEIDLSHIDYDFLSPLTFAANLTHLGSVKPTVLSPFILSGPR